MFPLFVGTFLRLQDASWLIEFIPYTPSPCWIEMRLSCWPCFITILYIYQPLGHKVSEPQDVLSQTSSSPSICQKSPRFGIDRFSWLFHGNANFNTDCLLKIMWNNSCIAQTIAFLWKRSIFCHDHRRCSFAFRVHDEMEKYGNKCVTKFPLEAFHNLTVSCSIKGRQSWQEDNTHNFEQTKPFSDTG